MSNFRQRFSALMILLVLAQPLHSAEEPIDKFLGKKYRLKSSDNFDNFMKAFKVRMFTRLSARYASPVDSLTKSGDVYTYTSKSMIKNIIQKFKPGVPFEYETPDRRKLNSTMTIAGNTLHEVQEENNGRKTTVDRTFSDEELKIVMKVGDVTATRIHKLIK